ncbi:Myb/SANT-like DNA-binding domain-containing protein [Crassisporium funariophilum]|nr:Myb/SANT-like DNA-binding domain-containing protein [Crassisporium funariophilum]
MFLLHHCQSTGRDNTLIPSRFRRVSSLLLYLSTSHKVSRRLTMGKNTKKAVKGGQTENNARCSWSSTDNATLVRILREQKDNGNQSGAGWKSQVWQAVADALKADGASKGAEKTGKKCADHWANLKKNFLDVSAIRNASGFGWDEGTMTCTATSDVWDKYLAAHPTAEQWRSTPFPLYNDIHILVNGIVAMGDGAFLPGRSLSPTATAASGENSEAGDLLNTSASLGFTSSSSSSLLHDSLANDIMETPGNLKSKTPCKRVRAELESCSPEPSVSHKKKHGKCHKTQADSLLTGMTGALLELTKAMNNDNGMATPQRRERAVDRLFQDEAFSPDGEGDLLDLFAENLAYADTYFVTKKKEAHVLFGQKLITRRRKQAEGLEN